MTMTRLDDRTSWLSVFLHEIFISCLFSAILLTVSPYTHQCLRHSQHPKSTSNLRDNHLQHIPSRQQHSVIQIQYIMPEKRTRPDSESDHEEKTSKRQDKRSKLEDAGVDDKERGQIRKAPDGGMLGYDPSTDAWVPAVYHSNIRDELLALTDSQGQYAQPRARGPGTNDRTSYLPSQQNWGPQRHLWHHIPGDILNQLEKRDYRDAYYSQRPTTWYHQSLLVLDHDNHPVRVFPDLPTTLSSAVEGWLIEAISRLDHRILSRDIWARLPLELEKTRPGRRKSNSEQDLFGLSTIGNRRFHFREDEGLLAWHKRKNSKQIEDFVKSRLSAEDLKNNSTARVGTPDAKWVASRKALRKSINEDEDTPTRKKRASRRKENLTERMPGDEDADDSFPPCMPPPSRPLQGNDYHPDWAQRRGTYFLQTKPASNPYQFSAPLGALDSTDEQQNHLIAYPRREPILEYSLRSTPLREVNPARDVVPAYSDAGNRGAYHPRVPSSWQTHVEAQTTINPQNLILDPFHDTDLGSDKIYQHDPTPEEREPYDPHLPPSSVRLDPDSIPGTQLYSRQLLDEPLPINSASAPGGRRRRRDTNRPSDEEAEAPEAQERHSAANLNLISTQHRSLRPASPRSRLPPYQSPLFNGSSQTSQGLGLWTSINPAPARSLQPEPILPTPDNTSLENSSSSETTNDQAPLQLPLPLRRAMAPVILDIDHRSRRPLTPQASREVQIALELTRQDIRSHLRGTQAYSYSFLTNPDASYNEQLNTLIREFAVQYQQVHPGVEVPSLRYVLDWRGSWQNWRIENMSQL